MDPQTLTDCRATHRYGYRLTSPSVSSTLPSDLFLPCQLCGRAWDDDDGGIHEQLEEDNVADILLAGTDSAQVAGRSQQGAQAGTEEADYEERNGVAPC